jgi:hypothetical protein
MRYIPKLNLTLSFLAYIQPTSWIHSVVRALIEAD